MTNETVIAILSELKKCYLGGIVDALDLAIEAVKEQKPETSDALKPDSDIGCWYDITHNYTLKQVVSALKAQEPKVMSLEEVESLTYGTPYVIETNMPDDEPRLMYGLYSHRGLGNITFVITDRRKILFTTDYGKRWRCWTFRPTVEQMEATPWNAQK